MKFTKTNRHIFRQNTLTCKKQISLKVLCKNKTEKRAVIRKYVNRTHTVLVLTQRRVPTELKGINIVFYYANNNTNLRIGLIPKRIKYLFHGYNFSSSTIYRFPYNPVGLNRDQTNPLMIRNARRQLNYSRWWLVSMLCIKELQLLKPLKLTPLPSRFLISYFLDI